MQRLAATFVLLRWTLTVAATLWAAHSVAADPSGTLYGVKSEGRQLVIRTLDLSNFAVTQRGAVTLAAGERLADVFQDKDRSVGVLRASLTAQAGTQALVRKVGIPQQVVDASESGVDGLPSPYAITSILVPANGTPIGFVSHFTDTPPYLLATLDVSDTHITVLKARPLDAQSRYDKLTQCPNGKVYALWLSRYRHARLLDVSADTLTLALLAELTFQGEFLRNAVLDLACGPSDQLYALADLDYSGVNSLYRVDAATGALNFVSKFDVERITFVQ